jgi:hypothetical protein
VIVFFMGMIASPRTNNVILTLVILCVSISTLNAFVTNSPITVRLDWVPYTSPTRPDLSLFHAFEGSDNEVDEEKRMEMVRSLQKPFMLKAIQTNQNRDYKKTLEYLLICHFGGSAGWSFQVDPIVSMCMKDNTRTCSKQF